MSVTLGSNVFVRVYCFSSSRQRVGYLASWRETIDGRCSTRLQLHGNGGVSHEKATGPMEGTWMILLQVHRKRRTLMKKA